jgi:mono/diheme cytochrome c family protein
MTSLRFAIIVGMLIAILACTSRAKPQSQSTGESFAEQTTPVGQASAEVLAISSSSNQASATQHSGNADPAHGKQLFAANCSGCHGASGEGGAGPSLHGERGHKNLTQVAAFVKDPQPPMPKLYPTPLSDADVRDVAAYVESL